MTKFFDNHIDVDSEAEVARRRVFIKRMKRKLELKESLRDFPY